MPPEDTNSLPLTERLQNEVSQTTEQVERLSTSLNELQSRSEELDAIAESLDKFEVARKESLQAIDEIRTSLGEIERKRNATAHAYLAKEQREQAMRVYKQHRSRIRIWLIVSAFVLVLVTFVVTVGIRFSHLRNNEGDAGVDSADVREPDARTDMAPSSGNQAKEPDRLRAADDTHEQDTRAIPSPRPEQLQDAVVPSLSPQLRKSRLLAPVVVPSENQESVIPGSGGKTSTVGERGDSPPPKQRPTRQSSAPEKSEAPPTFEDLLRAAFPDPDQQRSFMQRYGKLPLETRLRLLRVAIDAHPAAASAEVEHRLRTYLNGHNR